MTEGISAGGAPARVDPEDFASNADHLYVTSAQLSQLANLHAQEVLRFSADPERYTAQEVVGAWQEANAKVNQAMQHLAFVTKAIRTQRDGVVAALETAADHAEHHN